MRSRFLMPTRPVLLGAGLALCLAMPAMAIEYDGTWQFTLSCPANGAQAAFSDRFTAPIAQNVVTRTRSGRTVQGADDTSRFTGRVEAGKMTAVMERNRGGERWSLRFDGPAASDSRFDLAGGLFVGDRQLRGCGLLVEAVGAAPGSLAATAPVRAEATRTQLAAALAALAALEANSASEAQSLRTDLDLARFEAAAMRPELEQRSAVVTALQARLREAEGGAAQAQAAMTQAVAAATAEIGLRDQRLAAAAAERTTLQTRLATAEAATTQSQATAATERTALQARIATAEAATGQVQASATTERAALAGRLAAAEALAAQLRAALETAQRELTQARAAQPPR